MGLEGKVVGKVKKRVAGPKRCREISSSTNMIRLPWRSPVRERILKRISVGRVIRDKAPAVLEEVSRGAMIWS